jgi:hypothetical protein
MPVRESRLIAINEGERSLTAADVSAVYQINGDETKRSARNRMLANSHAGMATHLPPTWKLARPLNTTAFERSRWRGGRFACYAPHVMPQRSGSHCGSRACPFSKYCKTTSLQVSEKIEFP